MITGQFRPATGTLHSHNSIVFFIGVFLLKLQKGLPNRKRFCSARKKIRGKIALNTLI